MSIFIIGGTGFLGRRIVRRTAEIGQKVVCMSSNRASASLLDDFGKQVSVICGDITQFDDLIAAFAANKPKAVINLSYVLSQHPPHAATKLNILGMDKCLRRRDFVRLNTELVSFV
jgi:nucleoside-diphosphate-sugar epimerase